MEFFSSGWFYLLAALGFGFVIFIHELGHFLFAKWAGVRVERFSIGFGPPIFKKTIGETEYVLSLLPLGGYVKMLGQEDMPAEIPDEVRHDPRSYLAVGPWWQSAILLAGVLFNLVSSYIILLALAWHGMPVFDPVVGAIMPEIEDIRGKPQPSPAVQIGLRQGDRILTFSGRKVRSFEDLTMLVVTAGKDPVSLTVERRAADGTSSVLELPGGGKTIVMAPDFASGHPALGADRPKGWTIDSIKNVYSSQPVTGVKAGDRIVAIDGKPFAVGMTGQQIEDLLRPHLGREVTLGLQPGNREVTLRYAGGEQEEDLAIAYPVRIEKVVPGSAGEKAGLMAGDLLLKVDGVEVGGSSHFQAMTRSAMNEGRTFSITVLRDGTEKTVTMNGADINGRRLVGAMMVTVHGYLPFIPKSYDGSDSSLAQAHIVAGDAIVGYVDAKPGADRLMEQVLVVSGGKMHALPIADDDFLIFKKRTAASPLARMFGISPVQSIEQQLVDMRIENTGDGQGYPNPGTIHVSDHDGVKHSVNLSTLSKASVDALLADLKPGDWITGVTVLPNNLHALEVVRGAGATPHLVQVKHKDIGTSLELGWETHPYVLQDWTEAFAIANDAAYTMITKTLQIIPRFFRSTEDGGIDANKSLTGPIGIFSALKGNAERFGFDSYLKLIAIIGLNLFMVNLLPIPITDGGQLLILGIETLMRKPLPAMARQVTMYIGLAMVMALMLYVIGLDIMRHLGFL